MQRLQKPPVLSERACPAWHDASPPGSCSHLPLDEIRRPISRLREFRGGRMPPAASTSAARAQRQLGALAGCSQRQIANALQGHDRLAAAVIHRLHEILL
jgi:hypothetical protein